MVVFENVLLKKRAEEKGEGQEIIGKI